VTRAILVVVLLLLCAGPARADDGCKPYPVTEHSPSGLVGCVRYGEGIASRWPGPGVARNDCEYPWTDCAPIQVTALDTGQNIIVTPTMFCDCYQRLGPNGEQLRLVDLDPAAVAALGLDWNAGLYRVSVEPASIVLPDTAMKASQ